MTLQINVKRHMRVGGARAGEIDSDSYLLSEVWWYRHIEWDSDVFSMINNNVFLEVKEFLK